MSEDNENGTDACSKEIQESSVGEPVEDKVKKFSQICIVTYWHKDKTLCGVDLSYIGQFSYTIPSILGKMYGIKTRRLELSFNSIRSLENLQFFPSLKELILDNNDLNDSVSFIPLPRLQTFSLNKNHFYDLESLINQLTHCYPELTYLSLLGNPACPDQLSDSEKDKEDYKLYRYYIVLNMPQLKFLDFTPVKPSENIEAQSILTEVADMDLDSTLEKSSEENEKQGLGRYIEVEQFEVDNALDSIPVKSNEESVKKVDGGNIVEQFEVDNATYSIQVKSNEGSVKKVDGGYIEVEQFEVDNATDSIPVKSNEITEMEEIGGSMEMSQPEVDIALDSTPLKSGERSNRIDSTPVKSKERTERHGAGGNMETSQPEVDIALDSTPVKSNEESKAKGIEGNLEMSKPKVDIALSVIGQDLFAIPIMLGKSYGIQTQRLDLSFNSIRSLENLQMFPFLEELILDNNDLNDSVSFIPLPHLHTLSLNKNHFSDFEILLKQLALCYPELTYLSLLGNPGCPDQLSILEEDEEAADEKDYQRYRYYVIYYMPKLMFLDSSPVKLKEKSEAQIFGGYLKVAQHREDVAD